MRTLSHESLTVYQRSITFVSWSSELCLAKHTITGEIQSQYKRAFISIPLNIAEGAEGKKRLKDLSNAWATIASSVAVLIGADVAAIGVAEQVNE